MSDVAEYVVIEYGEPVSPGNRKAFVPVEGLGPVTFWATKAEFEAYYPHFPADGALRVMPAKTARAAGLL